MNPLKSFPLIVLLSAALTSSGSDVVIQWNALTLGAIKASRTPPPVAARNLAMVHIAIFEACNGISQNCAPYAVTAKPSGVASKDAAMATAARDVLSNLYPAQQSACDDAWRDTLAAVPDGPGKDVGTEWGHYVADAILQLRSNDGSGAVVDYQPGSGPGVWIPTPPAFLPALLPNWPFVECFAMTNAAQFRPPPPPSLSSAQWADDFNLTKNLGRLDGSTRTDEQTAIAHFWADGGGTVTPPGHWNLIARDLASQFGLSPEQNARLFALLNIAEADAGIIAWDCKYAFNFWRPVTAIRNADSDGNPDTLPDPAWSPLLVTPNFPEYISGHSTFSGAAAAVLASFFGSNEIAFTTESGDLPGIARSFGSFSSAAQEAGMSRIYGGIHFMSANRNGLESGSELGAYVAANFLLPRPGKSQRGH